MRRIQRRSPPPIDIVFERRDMSFSGCSQPLLMTLCKDAGLWPTPIANSTCSLLFGPILCHFICCKGMHHGRRNQPFSKRVALRFLISLPPQRLYRCITLAGPTILPLFTRCDGLDDIFSHLLGRSINIYGGGGRIHRVWRFNSDGDRFSLQWEENVMHSCCCW
jgi:hypothetical protein